MTADLNQILTGPRRPPVRHIRIALKVADWPAADQELWRVAFATGDLFDGAGPGAHLRPRTCRALEYANGRWLAFIKATEPALLDTAPAERVTFERLMRYSLHLSETNSASAIASLLHHLRGALRLIAPGHPVESLRKVARRIEHRATKRSKRDRLRLSNELYALGLSPIESAKTDCLARGRVIKRAALDYRDGLIIALLSVTVLRRGNLLALHIGTTIVKEGNRWVVLFEGAQTMNGREIEISLGDKLSCLVDEYMATFRPAVPNSDKHTGLWASNKGRRMNGDAIYARVCLHTKQAFGKPVNLHLFRNSAATFLVLNAPEQIGAARELLGHASSTTTEKHYTHAQTVITARKLATHIRERMERSAVSPRQRPIYAPNSRVPRARERKQHTARLREGES